jgi:hypothetical protein
MRLQIRAIAIYSKDGEVRRIRFHLGALNIVTGASKTGKSSLLGIVDYCWGRTECTIPGGDIRRAVSWFAVLLDREGEGILIARKSPGPAGRTSDEIYFERNVEDFPETSAGFIKNVTADALRAHLSSLLGIAENIHMPEPGATRRPLEASASQAIFFCLQEQDEIASRRLLFHRQGEERIPQAIKDALPYFVGAMDEDYYLKQKRYEDARGRLRRLERELADARAVANEASGMAQNLLQEARRVGLLSIDAAADTPDALRLLLAEAAAPRPLSYARLDDPVADLTDLEERRRQLRAELQELRDEISDLQRLGREASEFEKEALEQQARLSSLGLVATDTGAHDVCPLCDSRLEIPVPSVAELLRSLTGLELQLGSVRRDNPRLQARIAELERLRSEREEDLKRVQRDITTRIAENERLRIEQDQFTEQARVAGRISYYLENARVVSSDEGLRLQIARVRAEMTELERALDPETLEERLTTAMGLVSRDITTYAGQLGLEYGDNNLRLDRKNLTVVADTVDGPLPLPQIGSGENWVGYHVVAHLALHKLFVARRRPVPAFLMLDQPSQVHYPRDRDVGEISGEDEDHAAVAALFRFLWEYCQEYTPAMQIIVVDHVELLQEWFRSSMVERWRDGIKLVPMTWLR